MSHSPLLDPPFFRLHFLQTCFSIIEKYLTTLTFFYRPKVKMDVQNGCFKMNNKYEYAYLIQNYSSRSNIWKIYRKISNKMYTSKLIFQQINRF